MTDENLILDLYRHMEWADAEVWARVLDLPNAADDAALREKLHHIHLVQRAFLSIWRGSEVDPGEGAGLEMEQMAKWVREYHAAAQAHLRAEHSPWNAPVVVPWAKRANARLGFEAAGTTMRDTVVQVYAHTAHHRGQVTTCLRELGGEPPLIDYIYWIWKGRPAAAWRY